MRSPRHPSFLPSATKLRRFCFYRCLSTGGGYPSMPCRWYPSMPCSRSLGVVLSQHALQVVFQHALQQVSRGVSAWRRGACSGGVCSWGVWRPPESRRLLLQTVCILLECILVMTLLLQGPVSGSSPYSSYLLGRLLATRTLGHTWDGVLVFTYLGVFNWFVMSWLLAYSITTDDFSLCFLHYFSLPLIVYSLI